MDIAFYPLKLSAASHRVTEPGHVPKKKNGKETKRKKLTEEPHTREWICNRLGVQSAVTVGAAAASRVAELLELMFTDNDGPETGSTVCTVLTDVSHRSCVH